MKEIVEEANRIQQEAERKRQSLIQDWEFKISDDRKELEGKIDVLVKEFRDKHKIPDDRLYVTTCVSYLDDANEYSYSYTQVNLITSKNLPQ